MFLNYFLNCLAWLICLFKGNGMQISTFSSQINNTNINLASTNSNVIKLNGAVANSNPEGDSGRASMASNNEQEQCSPTFRNTGNHNNKCNF